MVSDVIGDGICRSGSIAMYVDIYRYMPRIKLRTATLHPAQEGCGSGVVTQPAWGSLLI